jgi:integrase
MSKTLTAAAVERLRPHKTRREISDGGCPGLFLVIQPGGTKSWAMRFRRPDGSPAKLTLGRVDISGKEMPAEPVVGAPLTLAGARAVAADVHRRRAMGRDVVRDHKTEKERRRAAVDEAATNTFGAAAREFFADHRTRRHHERLRRWRGIARTIGLSYPADGGEPTDIKGGLAEQWRDRPVKEIDSATIITVVDEACRNGIPGIKRKNTGVSEARGRAMFAVLSTIFTWLRQRQRVAVNPCAGVWRPGPPPERSRSLVSESVGGAVNWDEVRWFWLACDAADGPRDKEKVPPRPFASLLRMLLLTGARRDEVAGMTHDELSNDGAVWTIPGERTKNHRPHVVELPPLARDLIAKARSAKPKKGHPRFVFTTTGGTPVSGFSRIKARLDRKMQEIARKEAEEVGRDPDEVAIRPWRLHDLRRTCATGMANLGVEPHVIEAALNHVSGFKSGVAGTYNRATYAAERKTALERWAAHVDGLVTGKPANVVSMNAQRNRRQ